MLGLALIAAVEPSATGRPGHRPLDHPPVAAQANGGLDPAALSGAGSLGLGAIGAGSRSRIPCRRAACPVVAGVVPAGKGPVGFPEGAAGPGCRGCWRLGCRAGSVDRYGRRSGGSSIPSCPGRSDSVRSGAPLGGADAHRVDRAPGPVEPSVTAELVQDHSVQPCPDTALAPLGEAVVHGLPARPGHRRQLPPGAARGGYEDDRGERLPVLGTTPTTSLRAPDDRLRNHPPGQLPQLVRHQTLSKTLHTKSNASANQRKRRSRGPANRLIGGLRAARISGPALPPPGRPQRSSARWRSRSADEGARQVGGLVGQRVN